ncbi:MAG TPA: hypothetical protein VGO52_13380 [Hyphomonadaceae bacterium]|jgi:hypothetical protein|nr:hypothetical protein [Hyphomonadaceae bacterium]
MADTASFSNDAIAAEARELHELAQHLAEHAPQLSSPISRLEAAFEKSLAHAAHPLDAEQAAETFARRLRRVWLEAAGAEAGSVYRSPTASEVERIARHHDAFGYERDLQPETLEARATAFFPAPPAGWTQDHLIFSSGQAAMTSALLGLSQRLSPRPFNGQPIRIAHRGAYFETRALIKLMPLLQEATFAQTADIVLDEPICCDGQFHQIDTKKLLSSHPQAVIFDTTLLGRDDGVATYLASLGEKSPIVLRITSCLKLFEAGLELANAGILSVYSRGADDLGTELRRIRTLTGSGISLADAIALEAPWFLDAQEADRYAAAIFAHNARLAEAVSANNQRFVPVTHPSLSGANAPYCAFQLRHASPDAYDALESEIIAEATSRRLLLHHGGSFGFRGHRFEIVKPETGEPLFLRVALGRRAGWSCEGVVAMMSEIAGQ